MIQSFDGKVAVVSGRALGAIRVFLSDVFTDITQNLDALAGC